MKPIFTLWPTTGDLAADLKVPYTTAASWRARGSIPAKYDLDLVEAATRRGKALSLEDIARLRRPEAGAA